jgi:hypothetical protein
VKRIDRIRVLALLLLTFSGLSCATINVTDVWRDEKFAGPTFKKVYVVAGTQRTDMRQSFEDEFTRQLDAMGLTAIACHKCIPDFGDINVGRLIDSAQVNGAESILLVRFVNSERRLERERAEAPDASTSVSGVVSDNYMLNILSEYYDPPLTRVYGVVYMQLDFFDAKTRDLIWAASTETANSGRVIEDIKGYVKAVLKKLKEQQII